MDLTDAIQRAPMRTSWHQLADALPTTRWEPPVFHAQALLAHLQGPGGRTGSISSAELKRIHLEMCAELDIEPLGWPAVARELRKMLGDRKHHVDHERRTVIRIPPAPRDARSLRAV